MLLFCFTMTWTKDAKQFQMHFESNAIISLQIFIIFFVYCLSKHSSKTMGKWLSNGNLFNLWGFIINKMLHFACSNKFIWCNKINHILYIEFEEMDRWISNVLSIVRNIILPIKQWLYFIFQTILSEFVHLLKHFLNINVPIKF